MYIFFCFLEETVTNDNKFIQNNCALPTFTNFTEIKKYEKSHNNYQFDIDLQSTPTCM